MSVLSNRYFKAKPPTTSGYQRPADWLTLPEVTDTDDTFVGLYAIFPSGNNFAAFRFTTDTGDYQVDWGDGTVTTHASNTVAEHTYDYSTYDPTDTTLSSRGYKQAIIVVTPLTGGLETMNLDFRRTTTPAQNQPYATGFLDVVFSLPNCLASLQPIEFQTNSNVRHRYLEQVRGLNFGNATGLNRMFLNLDSLQNVVIENTPNITSTLFMFTGCRSLQSVPLFDTSNVTNWSNMFQNCVSLQSVPLFDTSNATNMNLLFTGCTSLQSVPLFDTSSVAAFGQTFNGCRSLQEIPALDTSSATSMGSFALNCNSLDRTDIVCPVSVVFSSCQLSQAELVNIFNNLVDRSATTAANINITGNWGASALTTAERDIALDKNWTITG